MLARVTTATLLAALVALSVIRVIRPPRPVSATAPENVFSAERAMRHVEEIAVRPHGMGMADHDRVRDYIVAQLGGLGLKPQIQHTTAIGTRYQAAGRVQNIIAWIPGSDTARKAVLLVAHYDGVEAGPAAADDGAGAAALLETLRALRTERQPLKHDVIALFTDGEEAGLLGAAAFVREHPWARDIAVVLNFEARGTTGRSFMFETGPGNLDAARALRAAGNATAGSVFTTVYRALPNDTDLSEFAVLNLPAMNFAFAVGVERYHTSRDDEAHLDRGSMQHHGDLMLALARIFANETLPRPRTGDAVFFDLPVLGLVVYPVALSIPLAVIAAVLVVLVVFRARRDAVRSLVGVGLAVVAMIVSAIVAWLVTALLIFVHARLPHGGSPDFRGIYAASIALLVIACCLALSSLARRWASRDALHAGVLIVWALITLAASIGSPAVGYLFVWPLLFAGVAELVPQRLVMRWIAAAVAILILAGLAVGASVVMLGLGGGGAVPLGLITAIVTLLVLPLIAERDERTQWPTAWIIAVAGVILMAIGFVTVRDTPAHPVPTALLYLENADSADAWLTGLRTRRSAWARRAIGGTTPLPAWASQATENARRWVGRRVNRVSLEAPDAHFIRDTIIAGARRVVLRLTAPRGATVVTLRAIGAPVLTSSIDGRVVDTTRYRRHYSQWTMEYWAVPDTGAIIALSIPQGAHIDLDMAARTPGLPAIPGTTIPPRPNYVVPIQTGDASIVYRQRTF